MAATEMVATAVCDAVSITVTVSPPATYTDPPSGIIAILVGPPETGTVVVIVFVAASITVYPTVSRVATYSHVPSDVTARPAG